MFGLISYFSVLIVVGFLKWIAPDFMKEENWTTGKEFILIVMAISGISLLNFVVILVLRLSEAPLPELFKLVVLYTIGISIIPVGVFVLFEQSTHQKKKLQQAQNLTKQLRKRSAPQTQSQVRSSETIAFETENGNIELQLLSEEIFFLNSDGNYS